MEVKTCYKTIPCRGCKRMETCTAEKKERNTRRKGKEDI